MFLRNFYNAYAASIMGVANRTADTNEREKNYKIIGLDGNTVQHYDSSYASDLPSIGNIRPSVRTGRDVLVFGTNDTPVDFNDTTFTPITGLGFAETKASDVIYSNGKWLRELNYTITNNNGFDITINEIGFLNSTQQNDGSSVGNYLYYRDVLDSPVVIGSGETVKFIYTCSFGF